MQERIYIQLPALIDAPGWWLRPSKVPDCIQNYSPSMMVKVRPWSWWRVENHHQQQQLSNLTSLALHYVGWYFIYYYYYTPVYRASRAWWNFTYMSAYIRTHNFCGMLIRLFRSTQKYISRMIHTIDVSLLQTYRKKNLLFESHFLTGNWYLVGQTKQVRSNNREHSKTNYLCCVFVWNAHISVCTSGGSLDLPAR